MTPWLHSLLGENLNCAAVLQPYAASFQQDVVVCFKQKRVQNKDLKLRNTPEKNHQAASSDLG